MVKSAKKKKNKLAMVARIILALGLLIFGINGFFQFLPPPRQPVPHRRGGAATSGRIQQPGTRDGTQSDREEPGWSQEETQRQGEVRA